MFWQELDDAVCFGGVFAQEGMWMFLVLSTQVGPVEASILAAAG